MDAKTLFDRCTQEATAIIEQIKETDYDKPTPCTDWNVRALANHMLYELAWVPDLVQGKTIAQVGAKYDGDLMGDDLQGRWREVCKQAHDAVQAADLQATTHLSYADVPNAHYISEIAGDILVHAWDAAKGIGQDPIFDEATVREVYRLVRPRAKELTASGLFGTPISVADTASTQTKLLGLLGRRA